MRPRRLLLFLSAAAVAITTAAGPTRLASAAGLLPTAGAPGFLPEPTPVRVTAPAVQITSLTSVLDHQRIPVAGGGESPDATVLLQFAGIALDSVSIAQAGAGFNLAISNGGSGTRAATIGGVGQRVQLWGVLRHLNLCLAALPGSAACPDVAGGIGALSLLTRSGAKLPEVLQGKNLDIDVYALTVSAAPGATSLDLPLGRLSVTPR